MLWGKVIYQSIFEARGLGLEKTIVAVESYNIAMLALYITLSVAAVAESNH